MKRSGRKARERGREGEKVERQDSEQQRGGGGWGRDGETGAVFIPVPGTGMTPPLRISLM